MSLQVSPFHGMTDILMRHKKIAVLKISVVEEVQIGKLLTCIVAVGQKNENLASKAR